MEEDFESSDAEYGHQRPWLWPLIGLVAVVTLLAVWLVPEDQPAPAHEPLPKFIAPTPPIAKPPPKFTAPTPLPPTPKNDTVSRQAETAEAIVDEPEKPTQTASIQAESTARTRAEPVAPAPNEPEPIKDGDIARRLIAKLRDQPNPDLTPVYQKAERLRADGKLSDAWLMHFFAARKGYAPSALVLGTLADPARQPRNAGALEKADPWQAYKWYKEAASAGNTQAVRRLQELRERTEKAAASGDEDAQRLLLQWR